MTQQELGSQAYQRALFADYNGAIQILDKAIAKFPRDEKLLNNRCYCLIKMKDYRRAQQDAEKMVKQFPRYPKGYYRNAEALAGMKRFIEAEQSLNYLLQLEPNCAEALELLNQIQSQNKIRRVSNLSFLDYGVGGSKGQGASSATEDIYYSDEDLDEVLAKALAMEKNKPKPKKKKGLRL